ncbi:monovalent cation:proton antiporter family protein [soil metagenome]
MEIPLLPDIVIILGLAVVVILVFQRFKLPTILGFLITGMIAGPNGFGLIAASHTHEVEILAEIGVILLLFIIGIEFSLKTLSAIKRSVFLGGASQVGITIVVVALLTQLLNFSWPEAIFLGFLFSLSSTAIVLTLLQEKGDINSPHGRIILAILIFQDIIVVPMMLFTPLIAGQTEDIWTSLLLMALKGLLVIVFVIVSARYIVPRLLYQVALTKSKELFILSIIVICFAVAWLTSSLGLSLALGAFMAGLIISESEYSHQATSNILPFREIFTSFFFVSIGMLLDLSFFLEHFFMIVLLALLTFVLKGLIAFGAGLLLRVPIRTALLVGLSLFQVGEFAFILSRTGIDTGLLAPGVYQYFLAVSLVTMALTPFVIKSYHSLANAAVLVLVPKRLRERMSRRMTAVMGQHDDLQDIEDHIVIIGYGINGRNLARAAREAKIPYLIIELNAETVKQEKALGEPIMYGDAVQGVILQHVHIQKARVCVIAISDPDSTKRIIVNIREISTRVHIIVRTRFIQEMDESFRLGADEVIPEEFETSIEIFTRVLTKYLVPRNEIEAFTNSIRAGKYEMLRTLSPRTIKGGEMELLDIEIATLRVQHPHPSIVGKRLAESNIRKEYGLTLVAIKRETGFIVDITAETKILYEDVLYVLGLPKAIATFNNLIKR